MIPTTYVLHYDKLPERRQFMEYQFEHQKFCDVVWYTDEEDNLEGIYDGVNSSRFTEKVRIGGWNTEEHRPRFLNQAEISLTAKFGRVFRLIAENPNPYSLLFEDDACLCPHFLQNMNLYLHNTPDDWDVIYMGSGANLHPKNLEIGKYAYLMDHPASRCADSILIKREAAKKLADDFFPFDLCSDWEIGYLQAKHKMNVYWWEPSLVHQGSETNLFNSSLR